MFSIKSVHLQLDKERSNLAVVLRWSRADASQARAAIFLQCDTPAYADFSGLTDKPRAKSYKTCAELHKPIYFCTHCCRTFNTRSPLWCLLKINNAGLVLSRYVIIPVCSEVLLYKCYLPPFRCKRGGWWLAEPVPFAFVGLLFQLFSADTSLVWLLDL